MSGKQSCGSKVTAELAWHERPLPSHWTADEVRFFRNWSQEIAGLHDALTSVAVGRINVLRRARSTYFKLAHKLTEEIRRPAVRP